MKRLLFIALILLIVIPGCSQKKISERDFTFIWQEYMQREFEESFDEKQSTAQKEKILKELLSKYKIPLDGFKEYMEKNHNEKYKNIFIE